jgi:ATP phosphoribosyltransferase
MSILRLAIQKKGRLCDASLALIKACGIDFNTRVQQLKAPAYNFPLEFFFLRDDDIPGYVHDAVADIGIVGRNEVEEKGYPLRIVENLGFAPCRLSIAVPATFNYRRLKDLEGKMIATSYPRILKNYLEKQGVEADIHEISGSVEIAPAIGLTDAICDLVSSGSTLLHNNLKEVETILHSTALLTAAENLTEEKHAILDKLLMRIRAVQRAEKHKYILLNAPNSKLADIARILPGMKSPTIMPLAEKGWSSLHSVIHEDDFWNIVEQLDQLGAQGILITPIEKIMY